MNNEPLEREPMNNEPLEREPIDRVRARLEALSARRLRSTICATMKPCASRIASARGPRPALPAELTATLELAADFARASKARATQDAYESDFRIFDTCRDPA